MVADAPWSDEAVLEQVRSYALTAMRQKGPVQAWIVDDTGFPKKGTHSVGVTRCAAQKLSEALQFATLGIVVTESGSISPSIFVMQTAEDRF